MKPMRKLNNKLFISHMVEMKLNNLVRACQTEIAWHGFVRKTEHAEYIEYYWYDVTVYPQEVTGATVTADENKYSDWLIRMMEYDNFEDMRLHGHSHVKMSTFPSGTDRNMRDGFLKNLRDGDFYIFLILNQKGDYEIELYDKENYIVFDKKDVDIIIGSPEEYAKALTFTKEALECLTTISRKTSSIHKSTKEILTSSDVEQSDQELLNFLADWE